MSRPNLVVHGHFYQPSRLDPSTGRTPVDPTAAPARDWNTRISADCYRPNAELGNLGAMSWDLGPTLAGWMADHGGDHVAYRGFVDGDQGINGLAQPFHHTILPLASAADRLTEVRWGLRDFAVRFGRPATGMWLPETAVDLATLRLLADEGVDRTILAPWQVSASDLDTRRPARVELGDGRSMVVAIYDGLLSSAVSFEPPATIDADAFVRDRIVPRFAQTPLPDGVDPLVIIATDGELYGHHQPQREHFLARLVGATAPGDRGFATPALGAALVAAAASERPLPTVQLRERTSWSCHHGIARWAAGCDCGSTSEWKLPLRTAFERLAGGIDAATEAVARTLPGSPDPWAAREAYVDVVIGATDATAFADAWLATGTADERRTFLDLMAAQRWRLSMFASCAWFWESPRRIETAGAIRAAIHAARLLDGDAGPALEARFRADLAAAGIVPTTWIGQAEGPDPARSGPSGVSRRRRRGVGPSGC